MTTDVRQREEQSERLKSIQRELLRCFIEVCQSEGLRWYLLGGTALGAVRHGGFIPWDDDIDVGLPRKDYEAFLSVAQKYLPPSYFLQCLATEKNCPFNFAKLRDSGTTFIEASAQNIAMNHGVYIDIFPLDGYLPHKYQKRAAKYKRMLLARRIEAAFSLPKKKVKLKHILFTALSYVVYPGWRGALKKRERLFQKYDYDLCDTVANYCCAWAEKEIMPKAWFGKGVEGNFDGIPVVLPEQTHQYLSQLYGDYMMPPPPEKRQGHHYCTVIDLDRPYTDYVKG